MKKFKTVQLSMYNIVGNGERGSEREREDAYWGKEWRGWGEG
jgi:hypothetical protein